MVDQLGIRAFRADAATAVRRAGAGERLVITVGGTPVAQLGPLDASDARPAIADLAARGLVTPARRFDRPPPELHLPFTAGARLDRLVGEIRGR